MRIEPLFARGTYDIVKKINEIIEAINATSEEPDEVQSNYYLDYLCKGATKTLEPYEKKTVRYGYNQRG